MKRHQRHKTILYILCDWLSAMVTWLLFFIFRKSTEESITDICTDILPDHNLWIGLCFIPLFWLLLYAIMGAYRHALRRARLRDLGQTLIATLIGGVILFFTLMLDDSVSSYRHYYTDFLFFIVVHFSLTYLLRLLLTTHTVRMVHRRQLGFPTLLIGSGTTAYNTFMALDHQEVYSGNSFVGFVPVDDNIDTKLSNLIPCAGQLVNLRSIVEQYDIEEVVVVLEDNQQTAMNQVLLHLGSCGDIIIKISPNNRDLLVGNVKADNLFHSPLLVINNRLMPEWEYSIKRIFDIVASILVMIILSPIYLITAIIVKCSSSGPVFFSQERIGRLGKPFNMIKFRSMYVDAEQNGPALAQDNDPRITPFGHFMRKVRLDELPQFFNVLKGNMSIVGPRPERQYYIDKIVERAPEYMLLQRIRPGITSWGQVKYGYASTIDEMIERLRYDLLYLDNMSLATDIKILIHTVLIIVQGRGR